MLTPRWRKILSDLWGSKGRTLLVVLSIAVGVFAVGVVSGGYLMMSTDIKADFMAANPHTALILTDPFDDTMLDAVRHIPGVAQVAGKSMAGGQVTIPGGSKAQIIINAIPDLSKIKMDKLQLVSGQPALVDREIYIDRGGMAALGVKEGGTLAVELADGRVRDLRVVGVVHDVYANAFITSRVISAYANANTVEWLGGSRLYSQMTLNTTGGPETEAYVREVAARVTDKIKKGGLEVYVTVAYQPGQHPAQSQVDAVLGLMAGLGILAVFLSTFLVINTIAALLSQQVRQIGVMKAVGADANQVMGMYLVLILLFGVIGLVVAVPLSTVAGYTLASGVVEMLNSGLGPMPTR